MPPKFKKGDWISDEAHTTTGCTFDIYLIVDHKRVEKDEMSFSKRKYKIFVLRANYREQGFMWMNDHLLEPYFNVYPGEA
jgi:hypothetical protein